MKSRFNPGYVVILVSLLVFGRETMAVQAHVTLTQNGTNFLYTLFNDEPVSSQEYLNVLHLSPNGPFEVGSTPSGWVFVTDNLSYIDWYCINPLVVNPNDVAPGSSLGGFSLRSSLDTTEASTYALTSWYRGLTNNGSLAEAAIQVPSVLSLACTITNVLHSSTNTFQFTVLGIPSFSYTVESSSNLVDWTILETNAAPLIFVETNASLFTRRFYRAVTAFDTSIISAD